MATENWTHFMCQKAGLEDLMKSINNRRPHKSELVGLISNGTDFHVWIKDNPKVDPNGPQWELKPTPEFKGEESAKAFAELIASGRIIPIGFNHPNKKDLVIYYFEMI
ncbi:MAG: hypothetical protein AAFQ68_26185 [Bacteroidota bacterium]